MNNDYEIFELDKNRKIKLFISKEHRFGTDSLLLGEFATDGKKGKYKTAVDLCSGCGIIPVMLYANLGSRGNSAEQIYAVEIQAEAVELLNATIRENSLGCVKAVIGDLRDEQVLLKIGRESADLVTANPPYYAENSGYERKSSAQKTARYDGNCKFEDVVKAAAFLLKFGGELKICMTARRLAECIGIMQKYSLEPKEIKLIQSKNNTARLFLLSGKKGGRTGVTVGWK